MAAAATGMQANKQTTERASCHLGHTWRASELELPLLAPWGEFATSLAAFVKAIA